MRITYIIILLPLLTGVFVSRTFAMQAGEQAAKLSQTSSSSNSIEQHLIDQLNTVVNPASCPHTVTDELQQQVDKILEGAVLTPRLLRYWVQFGSPIGLRNALNRMDRSERINLVNTHCAVPNLIVACNLFGGTVYERYYDDPIVGICIERTSHHILMCDFFELALALNRHTMIEVLLYAGYGSISTEKLSETLSVLLRILQNKLLHPHYLTAVLDSAVRYGAVISRDKIFLLSQAFGRQASNEARHRSPVGLKQFICNTLIPNLKFLIRLVVLYIRQINIPTYLPDISRDVLRNVVGNRCDLPTPLADIVVSYDSPIPCILPPRQLPSSMSQQDIIEKVIVHILYRLDDNWQQIYDFIVSVRPFINESASHASSSSSAGSASGQAGAAGASSGPAQAAGVNESAWEYCQRILNNPTIIDAAGERLLDYFEPGITIPQNRLENLQPFSRWSRSGEVNALNQAIVDQAFSYIHASPAAASSDVAMVGDNFVIVNQSMLDRARERAQRQANTHGLRYVSLGQNNSTQNLHETSTATSTQSTAEHQIANRQRDAKRGIYSTGIAAAASR